MTAICSPGQNIYIFGILMTPGVQKLGFWNRLSDVPILRIFQNVFGSLNKVPEILSFLKNANNKCCSGHMVSIKKWSQNDIFWWKKTVWFFIWLYIDFWKSGKSFQPKNVILRPFLNGNHMPIAMFVIGIFLKTQNFRYFI